MKRLAVILPQGWRGGMFRTVKSFCQLLLELDDTEGGPYAIVLGVVPNVYTDHDFAEFLDNPRFQLREVTWTEISAKEQLRLAKNASDLGGRMQSGRTYVRPQDFGGYDFLDCDAWVIYGTLYGAIIAGLRPYAIFAADWIQRVVPGIFNHDIHNASWLLNVNAMLMQRDARVVFATTPRTARDVTSYAGVPSSRVVLAPIYFEDFLSEEEILPPVSQEDYFIWTTNSTAHKNQLNAFKSLAAYYEECGGELNVVVTGALSDVFSPDYRGNLQHPYWDGVREFVKQKKVLRDKVHFMGELSAIAYKSYLKHARFLWHNVIYDNGTASVIEAAQLGVRTLSSDYPQMRYICDYFGINAEFFPAFDIRESAQRLRTMQDHCRDVAATFSLPHRHGEKLRQSYAEIVQRLFVCEDRGPK